MLSPANVEHMQRAVVPEQCASIPAYFFSTASPAVFGRYRMYWVACLYYHYTHILTLALFAHIDSG